MLSASPHLVGRRVDEIACHQGRFGDPDDVCDVDALGRHEPDLGRLGFAVTSEPIAAERKGEHRQSRIVRRIGETVDAGRQQMGQCTRTKQIARPAVRIFEAEQHLGDPPFGVGQGETASRLG